ncbi:MAG: DUF3347 domain-containing protein [Candidatus Dadabacteria bacterium]
MQIIKVKILLFSVLCLIACKNSSDNSSHADTITSNKASSSNAAATNETDGLVTAYLQLKNALAADDGQGAANAADDLIKNVNTVHLSSANDSDKVNFQEITDDMKEMAEHISKNPKKIEHQREHFSMLSDDMDDLLNKKKPGKTLYKVFCPMYNDNKGAYWYSETKEIRNPYLGKKMPGCGNVVKEIK